jgi:hypothetical protein
MRPGDEVVLYVSDPWEFGTACGTGPFRGAIDVAGLRELAIRLRPPVLYRQDTLLSAVVRPRFTGETFPANEDARKVLVNIGLSTSLTDPAKSVRVWGVGSVQRGT